MRRVIVKSTVLAAALTAFFASTGCGGVASILALYELVPISTTIPVNGTAEILATTTNGGVDRYDFTVRESGGGSVSQSDPGSNIGNYTAPNNPGTYHVDVTYWDGSNVVASRTFTATVEP